MVTSLSCWWIDTVMLHRNTWFLVSGVDSLYNVRTSTEESITGLKRWSISKLSTKHFIYLFECNAWSKYVIPTSRCRCIRDVLYTVYLLVFSGKNHSWIVQLPYCAWLKNNILDFHAKNFNEIPVPSSGRFPHNTHPLYKVQWFSLLCFRYAVYSILLSWARYFIHCRAFIDWLSSGL